MTPPPMVTAHDVPLLIISTASSSERRITPSWTISQLKAKLEPITGIPPAAQKLTLRLPDQSEETVIEAADEGSVEIGRWPLVAYAELKVTTTGEGNFASLPPLSSVEKYTMPESEYEKLSGTVLAQKKAQQVGRFNPKAPEIREMKVKEMVEEVRKRNIAVGARCILSMDSSRRGTIRFVGPIPSLPGVQDAPWVGVELDEPTGRNDGSVNGERHFTCEKNKGVFVRPEKVGVGDFRELNLDEEDPQMEEI